MSSIGIPLRISAAGQIDNGIITNAHVNNSAAIVFSKLEATPMKVQTGNYVGNGAATQAVAVAFRPRSVFIRDRDASSTTWLLGNDPGQQGRQTGPGASGGSALGSKDTTMVDLTATGFTVKGASDYNENLKTFDWMAFA